MVPKYLNFLFKPVDQEYFTKFEGIHSRDNDGNAVTVSLRSDNAKGELKEGLCFYCDKILIGETLESAIKRSLWDDFGLKLIDFDILVFRIDTANNKLGESVSRFTVITYVEYGILKNNKVVGCNTTWIDRRKYFLYEDMPEAMGWLKNNQTINLLGEDKTARREDVLSFVENLYQAGAVDIKISESIREQEPVESEKELNPDLLEVRLPKNAELRKTIFEIFNIGLDKKLRKKREEVDTGQITLRYYWS